MLSRPQLTNAVKLHKPISVMHKPIDNIAEVLKEVSMFNDNLHLCCLMTYGCLLQTTQGAQRILLGGTLQQICLILNYQEVEINQEEIE